MNRSTRTRTTTAAIALLIAAALLTACGPDPWCEFDATDTRVDDSHCVNDEPGYEWEPDGDDSHKIKKTSTTKKPAPTTRRAAR